MSFRTQRTAGGKRTSRSPAPKPSVGRRKNIGAPGGPRHSVVVGAPKARPRRHSVAAGISRRRSGKPTPMPAIGRRKR